jgi:hypothetical protein
VSTAISEPARMPLSSTRATMISTSVAISASTLRGYAARPGARKARMTEMVPRSAASRRGAADRHIRKRSMVFTANKHPKRWGEALHD